MLYIVPTPIGNLGDITLRSIEVLKSVDGIVCEDTRRTGTLLKHYHIEKPLLVLNDFNEAKEITRVIEKLKEGANIALVSDAGTPLISDPGYKLIRECISQNIEVDSLPGPSSVITALTLSGLPPDRFMFVGYPPEKTGHRTKWMEDLRQVDGTLIALVAPHKLLRTLENMKGVFGDIEICLAHELTKIHQSVETKKISVFLENLKTPKGEYILLFRIQSM